MSSSYMVPWSEVVAREREWCTAVVDAYGAAGVVLSESTLDLSVLLALTRERAVAQRLLPLGVVDGRLYMAAARPLAPHIESALGAHVGRRVTIALAAAPILTSAIKAAYDAADAGAAILVGLRAPSPLPHIELIRPNVLAFIEPLAGWDVGR